MSSSHWTNPAFGTLEKTAIAIRISVATANRDGCSVSGRALSDLMLMRSSIPCEGGIVRPERGEPAVIFYQWIRLEDRFRRVPHNRYDNIWRSFTSGNSRGRMFDIATKQVSLKS